MKICVSKDISHFTATYGAEAQKRANDNYEDKSDHKHVKLYAVLF